MNNIIRVSKIFRIFFQLLFIALPILLVVAWLTSPQSIVMFGGLINTSFIPKSYMHKIMHELTTTDRLLGLTTAALPMIMQLFILHNLIQLFKCYEKAEIFAIKNINYIRNIGYGLLITQFINPIYEFLMGISLTRLNPPGHRFASVTFDQTNISIIAIATIVILISWIMAEACQLKEEQSLTV